MDKRRFSTKFAALATVLGLGGCLWIGGCSVLNTGPDMVKATIAFQTILAEKMIGQIDFTQMTANAGAKVSDPRFSMRTIVGPCFVFDVELALAGADLDASIAGAGVGRAARNVEGNPPSDGRSDEGG